MLDRRDIIRLGVVGGALGLITPKEVFAAPKFDPFNSPAAGGLYYTKDAPGRWGKKVAGHLPNIERNGNKIEVTTGHPMKGYEHYIVKHQVLDGNFKLTSETMFDPAKDGAVSEHDISGMTGRLYVLSFCNIHDTWLNYLDI